MYGYTQLLNRQIRVAILHHGKFDDEISVSFEVVKLAQDMPFQYEALSYVWGTEKSEEKVQVCGYATGEIAMTKNLEIAIRHLRCVDKDRAMWIDAICIDQSNNVEKGPQVAMMGDVYRFAHRVVVWLGPSGDESDRAMKAVEHIGSNVDFDWRTFELKPLPTSQEPELADQKITLPNDEADLRSIYHLFCRPWFERLWIRQEILLANPKAIVICGTTGVLWSAFRTGMACIFYNRRRPFEFTQALRDRLEALRGFVFHSVDGLHLRSLRSATWGAKCADPRDRIYGILSILKESYNSLGIQPDYTKTVSEVYQDTLLRYFRSSNNLCLLSECQFNPDSGLPSWVPDWSVMKRKPLGNRNAYASGPLKASWKDKAPGVIQISAVYAARISRIRKSEITLATDLKIVSEYLSLLASPELLAKIYLVDGTYLDAFVRTLCLDNFHENYEPPSGSRPKFYDCKTFFLGNALTASYEGLDESHGSIRKFLLYARENLAGGNIFETVEGHIGLAPSGAKANDEIWVVLGCNSPMIMRPTGSDDTFSLISGCYTCGVNNAEAVLGSLPESTYRLEKWDEELQIWTLAFMDHATGISSLIDPRVSQLGVDTTEYLRETSQGMDAALEMSPETLKRHGVTVRNIDLV